MNLPLLSPIVEKLTGLALLAQSSIIAANDQILDGVRDATPRDAENMDPQERLLMQEVYKAIQDSGIDPAKLRGTKTGVFASYEYSEYEHHLRNNIDRIPERPAGLFFSSSSPSYYLANRISVHM